MRFAGQRRWSQRQSMPKQRADSGYVSDFTSPASVQGISPVMTNMRDINAQSMAFTAMPEMSVQPFNIPDFNEAQFRA